MSSLETSTGATPAEVDATIPVFARASRGERIFRVLAPLVMLCLPIALWQWYVTAYDVPTYRLPAPRLVAEALVHDWPVLSASLLVTLKITFQALAIAIAGGLLLAVVLTSSRWIEIALSPYLVFLQVTPLVAAAPLIIVYAPSTDVALLICAWIVCFYPMLSNIMQGLKSTDHNLLNLFELYGASWWKTFALLRLPAALPYFLTGLRISGGLALIAAVVAEFVAGAAGAGSGLAFRISESGYRLNYPRMFAAFLLVCAAGVAIFCVTSLISHLLLRRWHESAIRREN